MGMRDWVAKVVTGGAGVAEKGSLSRFPFLARTQEASRRRWGERRRLTVETLEPRLLLSVAAMPVGDFTLLNNAGAVVGSVALGSASSVPGGAAALTMDVNTANEGTGTAAVTSLVVNMDPTHVGTYTIDISMSGTTGAVPTVSLNGFVAGDIVNLGVYNEAVNFTANYASVTGVTSGYAAATYDADAAFVQPVHVLGTLAAAGNIGNVTMGPDGAPTVTVIGGDIYIVNENSSGTDGNIGTLDIAAVDLTGGSATGLIIATEASGAATANGGVTVAGATSLAGTGSHGMAVHVIAGTGAGATGGQVSLLGAVTLGANNGSGELYITSETNGFGIPNSNMGAVNLGPLTLEGSGGVEALITAPAVAPDNIGSINIGTVNITGSGNNQLHLGGDAAAITFTGGITIGAVTDNSTGGGDVYIWAKSVSGTIQINGFSATGSGSDNGYLEISDAGGLGGLSLGTLDINGSMDVNVNVTGAAGNITSGNITTDSSYTGLPNSSSISITVGGASSVSLASGGTIEIDGSGGINFDNTTGDIAGIVDVADGDINIVDGGSFFFTTAGSIVGATTIGNVNANYVGSTGDVTFSIGGSAASVTVGNISMGVGSAHAPTFFFGTGEVTLNDGMGALVTGNITTDSTGAATVEFNSDNRGTGTIANVSLGNVTIKGSGFANVIIGHNSGTNGSTGDLGIVSLLNVTISGRGNLELLEAANTPNPVNITGEWTFSNSTAAGGTGGSVYLEAWDTTVADEASPAGTFLFVGNSTNDPLDVGGWNIEFDNVTANTGFVGGVIIDAAHGITGTAVGPNTDSLDINSVDYYQNLAHSTDAGIFVNANEDAAAENGSVGNPFTGPVANINIFNPGDNSVGATTAGPGGEWNNIEWTPLSYVAALSIGNIFMAGGAEGTFVASVVPNDHGAVHTLVGNDVPNGNLLTNVLTGNQVGPLTDTIGSVTLTGDSNGLVLVADHGIGTININQAPLGGPAQTIAATLSAVTLTATATGITIDGNNVLVTNNGDTVNESGTGVSGGVVGSVGPLTVFGNSTAPTALSGNVTGVSVGDITLTFGNMHLDVTAQGGTVAADRVAVDLAGTPGTEDSIGTITVSSGYITGGSYLADGDIGAISESATVSGTNGITLSDVESDIAALSGSTASYGSIGAIAASGGFLHITGLLTSTGGGANDVTATVAAYDANENVGEITAAEEIQIKNTYVGGDLGLLGSFAIEVIRVPASASGLVNLPVFNVNGNVGIIQSGDLIGDTIRIGTITTGTIAGDPTWINAGDAKATISLNILNAVAASPGTVAPPVVVVTQGDGLATGSATDYIVSVGGTWTTSGGLYPNPPTMNLSLAFDGGGITDNTGNNVTINDMNGVTSVANTVLSIATRANPSDSNKISGYATGGLGAKIATISNSGPIGPLFNLAGFQDTYIIATNKGRNSFFSIVIEGNLTGSIGGPGSVLPNATATFVLSTSNAPILGAVENLEIEGEWYNPSSPDTTSLRSAQIFVSSLGEISFGSLQYYKLPDDAFSYEAVGAASSPNDVTYTGVNATSARDGFWHDLEDYGALTPLTGQVNVAVLLSSSVTKAFVGPTGQFEFIRFINNDEDSIGTFDITFTAGIINSIYLFGDSLGIQYNALDPLDPATTSSTDIYYGLPHNGNIATYPHTVAHNAIDFLEFSSTIGNIMVVDADPASGVPASVGPISVGYYVDVNDSNHSSEAPLVTYIGNPNRDDAHSPVADVSIVFAPVFTLTGADWTAGVGGGTLTETGAFTNYTWHAGDTVVLTGGTDVIPGTYVITGKTNNNQITLGSTIDGLVGNITDGTITGARTVAVYGSIGNISVDGSLGSEDGYQNIYGVVSSGGVGTITTNDPDRLITEAPPNSNFAGLVTDGSAGAITIAGNVMKDPTPGWIVQPGEYRHFTDGGNVAIVVGDPTMLALGPMGVANGNTSNWSDDVVGIVGTPSFGGNITVAGQLGDDARNVAISTSFRAADTSTILSTGASYTYAPDADVQAPNRKYAATYLDAAETMYNLDGVLFNISTGANGGSYGDNAFDREQVSAPDGIAVDVVAGGDIDTAIISGKRILVQQNESQGNDSITGSIIAGATGVTFTGLNNNVPVLTGATFTGGNIHGDIWSGEAIGGGVGVGTVIEAFSQDISGVYNHGGEIGDAGESEYVLVYATGGSPGDITSNILASADINGINVIAGSGTGGSLLANIIAGLDPLYEPNGFGGGGGGIIGSNNEILANNDIGNGPVDPGHSAGTYTNVVSSAGSQTWEYVESGLENDGVFFGGGMNSNFVAGVPIVPVGSDPANSPVRTHFNDAKMPIMQDADDSISIYDFYAEVNSTSPIVPPFGIGATNSNLNGMLEAAGSITIVNMYIAGNAIGNDGVAGRHVAAAGMGYKDASFADPNQLNIGTGDGYGFNISSEVISGSACIVYDLLGTFSSGMFVPANSGATVGTGVGAFTVATNSPLNPADLGPMVAGTVLTLGSVDIYDMTVGRWVQTATGTTGLGVGITLANLLSKADAGTNQAYSPDFSIGATLDIKADIYAEGRPSQSNVSPDPDDGDIAAASVAAFGSICGSAYANDAANFTFVMSNIGSVSALNSTHEDPTTPSSPSFFLPLNSDDPDDSDNDLSITAYGYGIPGGTQLPGGLGLAGGVSVEFYTAGYDYFYDLNGGTFLKSFSMGSVTGYLIAESNSFDAGGLSADNVTFAFYGAGQDVTSDAGIGAANNIEALTNATQLATDDGIIGAGAQFSTLSADKFYMIAGLSALGGTSPTSDYTEFPGGNFCAEVLAGGAIGSAADPLAIAALGDCYDGTGNISGDFALVSGIANQVNQSITNSNIYASVIASGSIGGLIDAGDTQEGGYTDTDLSSDEFLGQVTDKAGGSSDSFNGAIWAGAGNDLNIFTITDNQVGGSISANIDTAGNLNVAGANGGIYAQDSIDGYCGIQVGWGPNGGSLYGNVVAQNEISIIEVDGNLGATPVEGGAAPTGLIFAGDNICLLAVGNPVGYDDVAGHLFAVNASTSTFGWVYDDVYIGEVSASATPQIYIGQGFAAGTVLLAGLDNSLGVGCPEMVFETFGHDLYFGNDDESGSRMVLELTGSNNPAFSAPNVWLFSNKSDDPESEGPSVGLDVYGSGPASGVGTIISLNELDSLNVYDGSVGQVIVDNGYNIAGAISNVAGPSTTLGGLLAADASFATASLPAPGNLPIEEAVGVYKTPVDLGEVDVEYNLGSPTAGPGQLQNIGLGLTGLTTSDNAAIWVAGNLTGDISSAMGSIGNIVVNGALCAPGAIYIYAQQSIGDVYIGQGSIGPWNVNFTAETGSIGVVSAEDCLLACADDFDIAQNIGGLISRDGNLKGYLDVNGSIGLLQASGCVTGSYKTETGSIGVLNAQVTNVDGAIITPASTLALNGANGIYSDLGTIKVCMTAGTDIGNLSAYSYLEDNNLTAGGNIGNLTSVTADVSDNSLTAGGNIGNLSAYSYIEENNLTAGGSIGNMTTTTEDIYENCLIAGGSIGNLSAFSYIEENNLTAGASIGNITSRTDEVDGYFTAAVDIGNVTASGDIYGSYIAQTGSIGNFLSDQGDVNVTARAQGTASVDGVGGSGIGNVTAGDNVYGTYTVTMGTMGNITALTGSIGNSECALSVTANGGVSLDPYTLLQVVTDANGNPLDGVGTLYSPLGNIYAKIITGGSVGVAASTVTDGGSPGQTIGGIAAPQGCVNVTLDVGGNVGGVSGQNVDMNYYGQSLIMGSIGLLRNVSEGSQDVQGVTALNPLIIQTTDSEDNVLTDYIVEVGSGSASVEYSVNYDGTVCINSITYNIAAADESSDGIQVLTRTGQRTAAGIGAMGPSSIQVDVQDMVINAPANPSEAHGMGDIGNITVDGSLDNLTVNGNLTTQYDSNEGTGLLYADKLGCVYVSGDIGNGYNSSNPFVALGENIEVANCEFGSLTVGPGSTNYGLVHTTISSGQWLTWVNSLRTTDTVGDGYITVYLGRGKADLTINNGYLQEVDIAGGSASNLVVIASDTQFDEPGVNGNPAITGPNDNGQYSQPPTSVSAVTSDDRAALREGSITSYVYNSDIQSARGSNSYLSSQLRLILAGTSTDEVFDTGPKTANVGIIAAEKTAILNLNGVAVEGDIQNIEGRIGKSSINDVITAGDLGSITGGRIDNLYINGNLCTLNGTVVYNVHVGRNAGTLNATNLVEYLYVGGNLDSVTANLISGVYVVGDVSDTITATHQAVNVNVGGNAGLVDGGVNLINVNVKGCVDAVKATSTVKNIHVGGNAGIVSSGNLLSQVTVGGSAITVGATTMSAVQITGSVGFGLNTDGDVVLGNAFSVNQAAWDLGLNPSEMASAGSKGPNCVRYFGGLEAARASDVSVGGSISELLISQYSTASDSLFNSTVDNALMYTRRGLFEKQDGVLTVYPGQPQPSKALIAEVVEELKELFRHH